MTALDWLPPVVFGIALTAWTLAFAGLVSSGARSPRIRLAPPLQKP